MENRLEWKVALSGSPTSRGADIDLAAWFGSHDSLVLVEFNRSEAETSTFTGEPIFSVAPTRLAPISVLRTGRLSDCPAKRSRIFWRRCFARLDRRERKSNRFLAIQGSLFLAFVISSWFSLSLAIIFPRAIILRSRSGIPLIGNSIKHSQTRVARVKVCYRRIIVLLRQENSVECRRSSISRYNLAR